MALAARRPEHAPEDELLGRLRRMIADGTLPPGYRLPPERQLAEQMHVNRTLLRKALEVLAQEGAISRQVGRGTFVGRTAFAPGSAIAHEPATPMEVMDARLALEPVIAGEAALRARQADLRRMRLCLKRGDSAVGFELFEEWDSALHRAIAEAAQNVVYVMVMDIFARMRAGAEWDRLKRLSLTKERQIFYRGQHRAIVEAIAERDPKAAARCMREHLASVRDALSGAAI